MNLKIEFSSDSVILDGKEVTNALRAEDVGAGASRVAAYPEVRDALLDRQRAFRQPPGLVADGRDMGSVVFPDATLKIYLTAGARERALRRYKQLIEKGMSASISALLQEIRDRDARDSARAVSPLQKCADAIELDTTDMSIEAAVAAVLAAYRKA
jgi:cytidylate kinase